MDDGRPVDAKVGVKPVFVQLLHAGAYEGPCRVGRPEDLDPETEEERGAEQFKTWIDQVERDLSQDARLLEPITLQWKDDWHVPESELQKIGMEIASVDLFLVRPGGLRQYPSIAIARRFEKPVVMVGTVGTMDVAAFLRSKGLDAYSPLDSEQLKRLVSLFKVKKALSETKILHALEGDLIPVGVVSTIYDLEDLQDRFGVRHVTVPAARLLERMDGLAPASATEAEQLTDRLIDRADQSHMSRDDVLPSVKFYVAVRRAMEECECNAFTIPCFELCALQLPAQRRATFCLAHSLLKDEGYPAACEGDTNVLMAMAVLMYLSGKSPYMGNCSLFSKAQHVVRISHSVPGLKMKGLDGPDLPYAIRPFTVGGWGATLRYDFSRDTSEPVTLVRFDPTAKRLLVALGQVVGGEGYDQIGCSLGVHVSLKDVVDFFEKQQDFGHHMAMVYGDYTEDLRRLGPMIGVQVVEA